MNSLVSFDECLSSHRYQATEYSRKFPDDPSHSIPALLEATTGLSFVILGLHFNGNIVGTLLCLASFAPHNEA